MITEAAVALAVFASSVGFPVAAGQPTDGRALVRQLDLQQAWTLSRGAGVTVGLVDTGVDATEPGLAGRVLPGAEFPDLGAGTADPQGHGTTMALLIAEVAPAATILPARLDGGADDANAAIRWVVDHGAGVVNLSLGSGTHTTAFDQGLAYARAHDAVVVAAAGDADTDPGVVSPADRPGVLAVSAVDRTGHFDADVSVQGAAVALSAPGVDLTTTRRGETAPTSGTSQAAAIVSAVVALVRARFPDLSADDVVRRLTSTATDAGPPGRDPRYGFGVVDPTRALTAPEDGSGGHPWRVVLPVVAGVLVLVAAAWWVRRRRLVGKGC